MSEKDMNIQLFVTDLDGTLLPTGRDVPQVNIDAVQRAVKAGVTVTIATGRMYRAALPVAQAIGVDVPIITYNGALIKSVSGEIYDENYVPEDVVRDLVDFAHAHGWYVQTYSDDELYFAEHTEKAIAYEKAQVLTGHTVGWDGLKAHTEKVAKVLVISDDGAQTDERIAILNEAFAGRAKAVRSNPEYAEVVYPGVSKASALKKLAAKLRIPIENVMAIGDANNDLLMLQAAGHSVAMGNALPEVKAACEFTVGDCMDGGFAEAIERFVLHERK